MWDDENSLVYITLGNKFTINEGKFYHRNILQLLNLLITETQILKIDLPSNNSIYAPSDVFELDVRCLCLIPNKTYDGKSIPDMEIIGGINLFTNAGNLCQIIDRDKAYKKYFNEYLSNELAEEHLSFLKENPSTITSTIIYGDWNTEEVAENIESEMNEDLNYFGKIFEEDWNVYPNRLGFYSWLFSDGLLTYDVLSEEIYAKGVEVTYSNSHEFSKPIEKGN